MTEPLPIPASAIEAAADAMEVVPHRETQEENPADIGRKSWEQLAEAALRAAFDDLRMEEVRRGGQGSGLGFEAYEYRLVSKWMELDAS